MHDEGTTARPKGPTVFLDRDGVICELRPDPISGELEGPIHVSDTMLVAGAAAALVRLRAAGATLVGVTNQPSAAKGIITLEEQEEIQAHVIGLLHVEGVVLDRWELCPHHPVALLAALRVDCHCRKPRPGMLINAATELDLDLSSSYMIGDSDTDIEAGLAVGATTVILGAVDGHKRRHPERADAQRADLAAAVEFVLGHARDRNGPASH